MSKFTFDVKMFATVRVGAKDESEARAMIADCLDYADCNGGAWPNGEPILFEAGVDGSPDLIEIDGECVC